MEAYIRDVLVSNNRITVLFSGCDYKCRFCNAPELLEQKIDDLKQLRDIKNAIDESGAKEALFTGGEPLLQRLALLDLLRYCKSRSIRTVVETNASKPDRMKTLLDEPLVDELIVSVKAPLGQFEKVTRASTFFKPAKELYDEFKESLQTIKQQYRKRNVALVARIIIVPGLLYKKEDLIELAKLLEKLDAEIRLIPFNPANTLDPTLRGVSPPTEKFLENLAGFMKNELPKLNVVVGEREEASS